MAEADYKLYINDILKCIKKIRKYVESMDFNTFVNDEKTYDAVLRNLEIIGEAANKIPKSITDKHSNIEWRKVSGLRNILIHDYSGIDDEIVWDVINNKLPEFRKLLQPILKAK